MVNPEMPTDAEPVRLGKDPVAPAYAPVPPVTVNEPVIGPPARADAGTENAPVIVPPEASVMVKLPGAVEVRLSVPLKVPFPMLVKVAGPVNVIAAPMLPVALVTVKVVLMVAAWAAAQIHTATVKFASLRIIYVCRFPFSSFLTIRNYTSNRARRVTGIIQAGDFNRGDQDDACFHIP
jgi:hypothetical protein